MGPPAVLAYGGGAFMDPATRALTRERALAVWLRCELRTLVRRVASRENRPLLANQDHEATLAGLMARRYPIYAEADIVVDCGDEMPETTTAKVLDALTAHSPPRRLPVLLPSARYDVVIGDGLLARAGALLAPVLPQKRAVVVSDANVARLHMKTVLDGLRENGFETGIVVVPAGEATKTLESWQSVVDQLLEAKVE